MHYRTLPTQQEGHQDNAPRQHRRDHMGVVGSSAEGAPKTLLRGRESRTSSKLRHIRIRATSSKTLTTSTSEVSQALGYRRCAKTRICPSSCRSRWSSTKSSNRTPSTYKYVRWCGRRRQSLSTMKKQARRSKSEELRIIDDTGTSMPLLLLEMQYTDSFLAGDVVAIRYPDKATINTEPGLTAFASHVATGIGSAREKELMVWYAEADHDAFATTHAQEERGRICNGSRSVQTHDPGQKSRWVQGARALDLHSSQPSIRSTTKPLWTQTLLLVTTTRRATAGLKSQNNSKTSQRTLRAHTRQKKSC